MSSSTLRSDAASSVDRASPVSLESSDQRYLSFTQRWSYSVGHVFNDLCAAFWFSYLLVYMTEVNDFRGEAAGNLMLIGQVADGIATPFIGIECDKKLDWWICRFGRRKMWHLFGTVCVFVSFPFIFNQCIYCTHAPTASQIFYYSAFIIIFQFGWASVQIAHMALITDLTPISSERCELNAYRYAFTVFANIFVFCVMWAIMAATHNTKGGFAPSDASMFRNVGFIIMGVGCCFSLIFQLGVKEKVRCDRDANASQADLVVSNSQEDLYQPEQCLRWYHWLKEMQFWFVAIIYMGSRLTINITQVYLVKYVSQTLGQNKDSAAYFPLTIYVIGFLSSFFMKKTNSKLGKRLTFLMGAITALAACAWMYLGNNNPSFVKYEFWAVTVLIGVSSTTLLVTSMSITSDLIGQNITSGAFVFGTMSFFDKVSNGLAVQLLETFKTCTEDDNGCGSYYRDIMSLVCGAAVCVALLGLTFQRKTKFSVPHVRRSPAPTSNLGYEHGDDEQDKERGRH